MLRTPCFLSTTSILCSTHFYPPDNLPHHRPRNSGPGHDRELSETESQKTQFLLLSSPLTLFLVNAMQKVINIMPFSNEVSVCSKYVKRSVSVLPNSPEMMTHGELLF